MYSTSSIFGNKTMAPTTDDQKQAAEKDAMKNKNEEGNNRKSEKP